MISTFSKKILVIGQVLLISIGCANASELKVAQKPENAIIDIQTWTTQNGADVYFVESHELPMLDIQVIFDGGSARDGADFGVANFTNAMIGEGTKKLNTDQIAEQFENVGAIFAVDASRDSATVSLRTLTESKLLQPALNTFAEVLNEPSFPTKNFKRIQKQILQAIEEQQQSPQAIATKAFYETTYGKYPYGHSPIGNKSTISELATPDLSVFYKKYYVGSNATVAIVGDINRQQAEAIANQVVGKLPKGSKPKKLENPTYHPQEYQKHIDFPASQTNVRIGEFGIQRNNPSYFPITVGNYVLGGGMLTSRLFKEVRDNKGYTYNIHSYFIPMKNTGPFLISLTSRNESATDAINLSKQLLTKFIEDGPTEKELSSAKKFLIGSFPLNIDSNSAITANIAMIGFYNLPLTYLDTYREHVSAVTNEQVINAFKTHINPEKLVIVTVGPEEKVEKANKELAFSDLMPIPFQL